MAVNMEKFNCGLFEIKIEFDEKQFQKKNFILDVKPDNEEDVFFHYHFGSKNKRVTDLAILDLIFDGKTSSLRLVFTPAKDASKDNQEPYLEDVTQWLAGFFNTKDFQASISAIYDYKNDFEPIVNLDFPLLIKNELYSGVNVAGLVLNFPKESEVKNIYLISVNQEEALAMLSAKPKIDLLNFDFYETVKKYSTFTSGFFEKKVKKNAKTNQRK